MTNILSVTTSAFAQGFAYLPNCTKWVIKIGSSSLTYETKTGIAVNTDLIASVARQISLLHTQNKQVILVTSGAVAMGAQILALRPTALYQKQACAALGQGKLMSAYDDIFSQHDIKTAQMLLTHSDWADRTRFLNMRNTVRGLLGWGILPVINENDCVSTEEMNLGDNDTLAAFAAQLIQADLVVLLTDVDGLYSKNPAVYKDAQSISCISVHNPILDKIIATNDKASKLGQGGIKTKIAAAKQVARSGGLTVIADARHPNVLVKLNQGQPQGTLLGDDAISALGARKQWISSQRCINGSLALDDGAVRAIRQNKNLLAIGIMKVSGQFSCGAVVVCLDKTGYPIAQGIVNYSHQQIDQIKGISSAQLSDKLGVQSVARHVMHADKLVLL